MSSGPAGAAGAEGPEQAGGGQGQPSEEELRAAYEAELSRLTSAEMALQAAVSLLNIGGLRMSPPTGGGEQPRERAQDLEQVRDAIDGVRGLLGVLERRMPEQIAPLRDALSRLQMAYAREAAGASGAEQVPTQPGGEPAQPQSPETAEPSGEGERQQPGPAESSGRLWVPGR